MTASIDLDLIHIMISLKVDQHVHRSRMEEKEQQLLLLLYLTIWRNKLIFVALENIYFTHSSPSLVASNCTSKDSICESPTATSTYREEKCCSAVKSFLSMTKIKVC